MAATDGPEAVILAVVNTLQTHLPAELAAIRTARNDTLPLDPALYLAHHRVNIAEYPAITVGSSGGKLAGDGSTGWNEMEHQLEVMAALQSNEVAGLQTQSMRMLLAIQECLNKRQQLDGTVLGLSGVSLGRYGNAVQRPANGKTSPWTAYVAWEVTVHTVELL